MAETQPSSGKASFNIPKIRRESSKDNVRSLNTNSRDAQDILNTASRSYLESSYSGPWEVKAVKLVDNIELEEKYRAKRAELKEQGRHARDLQEQFMFILIKNEKTVASITQQGLKTKRQSYSTLGDSSLGVYVCRHADVQLKVGETWGVDKCFMLVFKVTLGKCKILTSLGATGVEPAPNFDCHIYKSKAMPSDTYQKQQSKSQVYLYEYNDDCDLEEHPRHCLPYAVIVYKRVKSSSANETKPSGYVSEKSKLSATRPTSKPADKSQVAERPRNVLDIQEIKGQPSFVTGTPDFPLQAALIQRQPSWPLQSETQPGPIHRSGSGDYIGLPHTSREDPRLYQKKLTGDIDEIEIGDRNIDNLSVNTSDNNFQRSPRCAGGRQSSLPSELGSPQLTGAVDYPNTYSAWKAQTQGRRLSTEEISPFPVTVTNSFNIRDPRMSHTSTCNTSVVDMEIDENEDETCEEESQTKSMKKTKTQISLAAYKARKKQKDEEEATRVSKEETTPTIVAKQSPIRDHSIDAEVLNKATVDISSLENILRTMKSAEITDGIDNNQRMSVISPTMMPPASACTFTDTSTILAHAMVSSGVTLTPDVPLTMSSGHATPAPDINTQLVKIMEKFESIPDVNVHLKNLDVTNLKQILKSCNTMSPSAGTYDSNEEKFSLLSSQESQSHPNTIANTQQFASDLTPEKKTHISPATWYSQQNVSSQYMNNEFRAQKDHINMPGLYEQGSIRPTDVDHFNDTDLRMYAKSTYGENQGGYGQLFNYGNQEPINVNPSGDTDLRTFAARKNNTGTTGGRNIFTTVDKISDTDLRVKSVSQENIDTRYHRGDQIGLHFGEMKDVDMRIQHLNHAPEKSHLYGPSLSADTMQDVDMRIAPNKSPSALFKAKLGSPSVSDMKPVALNFDSESAKPPKSCPKSKKFVVSDHDCRDLSFLDHVKSEKEFLETFEHVGIPGLSPPTEMEDTEESNAGNIGKDVTDDISIGKNNTKTTEQSRPTPEEDGKKNSSNVPESSESLGTSSFDNSYLSETFSTDSSPVKSFNEYTKLNKKQLKAFIESQAQMLKRIQGNNDAGKAESFAGVSKNEDLQDSFRKFQQKGTKTAPSSVSSVCSRQTDGHNSENLADISSQSSSQTVRKKGKVRPKVNRDMMGYKKRRRRKRKTVARSDTSSDRTGDMEIDSIVSGASSECFDEVTDIWSDRSWVTPTPSECAESQINIPQVMAQPLTAFGITHWSQVLNRPDFQPVVVLTNIRKRKSPIENLKVPWKVEKDLQLQMNGEKSDISRSELSLSDADDTFSQQKEDRVKQWIQVAKKKIKLTLKPVKSEHGDRDNRKDNELNTNFVKPCTSALGSSVSKVTEVPTSVKDISKILEKDSVSKTNDTVALLDSGSFNDQQFHQPCSTPVTNTSSNTIKMETSSKLSEDIKQPPKSSASPLELGHVAVTSCNIQQPLESRPFVGATTTTASSTYLHSGYCPAQTPLNVPLLQRIKSGPPPVRTGQIPAAIQRQPYPVQPQQVPGIAHPVIQNVPGGSVTSLQTPNLTNRPVHTGPTHQAVSHTAFPPNHFNQANLPRTQLSVAPVLSTQLPYPVPVTTMISTCSTPIRAPPPPLPPAAYNIPSQFPVPRPLSVPTAAARPNYVPSVQVASSVLPAVIPANQRERPGYQPPVHMPPPAIIPPTTSQGGAVMVRPMYPPPPHVSTTVSSVPAPDSSVRPRFPPQIQLQPPPVGPVARPPPPIPNPGTPGLIVPPISQGTPYGQTSQPTSVALPNVNVPPNQINTTLQSTPHPLVTTLVQPMQQLQVPPLRSPLPAVTNQHFQNWPRQNQPNLSQSGNIQQSMNVQTHTQIPTLVNRRTVNPQQVQPYSVPPPVTFHRPPPPVVCERNLVAGSHVTGTPQGTYGMPQVQLPHNVYPPPQQAPYPPVQTNQGFIKPPPIPSTTLPMSGTKKSSDVMDWFTDKITPKKPAQETSASETGNKPSGNAHDLINMAFNNLFQGSNVNTTNQTGHFLGDSSQRMCAGTPLSSIQGTTSASLSTATFLTTVQLSSSRFDGKNNNTSTKDLSESIDSNSLKPKGVIKTNLLEIPDKLKVKPENDFQTEVVLKDLFANISPTVSDTISSQSNVPTIKELGVDKPNEDIMQEPSIIVSECESSVLPNGLSLCEENNVVQSINREEKSSSPETVDKFEISKENIESSTTTLVLSDHTMEASFSDQKCGTAETESHLIDNGSNRISSETDTISEIEMDNDAIECPEKENMPVEEFKKMNQIKTENVISINIKHALELKEATVKDSGSKVNIETGIHRKRSNHLKNPVHEQGGKLVTIKRQVSHGSNVDLLNHQKRPRKSSRRASSVENGDLSTTKRSLHRRKRPLSLDKEVVRKRNVENNSEGTKLRAHSCSASDKKYISMESVYDMKTGAWIEVEKKEDVHFKGNLSDSDTSDRFYSESDTEVFDFKSGAWIDSRDFSDNSESDDYREQKSDNEEGCKTDSKKETQIYDSKTGAWIINPKAIVCPNAFSSSNHDCHVSTEKEDTNLQTVQDKPLLEASGWNSSIYRTRTGSWSKVGDIEGCSKESKHQEMEVSGSKQDKTSNSSLISDKSRNLMKANMLKPGISSTRKLSTEGKSPDIYSNEKLFQKDSPRESDVVSYSASEKSADETSKSGTCLEESHYAKDRDMVGKHGLDSKKRRISSESHRRNSSPSRKRHGSPSWRRDVSPSRRRDGSPSRRRDGSPSRRRDGSPSRRRNSSPSRRMHSSRSQKVHHSERMHIRNSDRDRSPRRRDSHESNSPSQRRVRSRSPRRHHSHSRGLDSSPNESSSRTYHSDRDRSRRRKDSSDSSARNDSPNGLWQERSPRDSRRNYSPKDQRYTSSGEKSNDLESSSSRYLEKERRDRSPRLNRRDSGQKLERSPREERHDSHFERRSKDRSYSGHSSPPGCRWYSSSSRGDYKIHRQDSSPRVSSYLRKSSRSPERHNKSHRREKSSSNRRDYSPNEYTSNDKHDSDNLPRDSDTRQPRRSSSSHHDKGRSSPQNQHAGKNDVRNYSSDKSHQDLGMLVSHEQYSDIYSSTDKRLNTSVDSESVVQYPILDYHTKTHTNREIVSNTKTRVFREKLEGCDLSISPDSVGKHQVSQTDQSDKPDSQTHKVKESLPVKDSASDVNNSAPSQSLWHDACLDIQETFKPQMVDSENDDTLSLYSPESPLEDPLDISESNQSSQRERILEGFSFTIRDSRSSSRESSLYRQELMSADKSSRRGHSSSRENKSPGMKEELDEHSLEFLAKTKEKLTQALAKLSDQSNSDSESDCSRESRKEIRAGVLHGYSPLFKKTMEENLYRQRSNFNTTRDIRRDHSQGMPVDDCEDVSTDSECDKNSLENISDFENDELQYGENLQNRDNDPRYSKAVYCAKDRRIVIAHDEDKYNSWYNEQKRNLDRNQNLSLGTVSARQNLLMDPNQDVRQIKTVVGTKQNNPGNLWTELLSDSDKRIERVKGSKTRTAKDQTFTELLNETKNKIEKIQRAAINTVIIRTLKDWIIHEMCLKKQTFHKLQKYISVDVGTEINKLSIKRRKTLKAKLKSEVESALIHCSRDTREVMPYTHSLDSNKQSHPFTNTSNDRSDIQSRSQTRDDEQMDSTHRNIINVDTSPRLSKIELHQELNVVRSVIERLWREPSQETDTKISAELEEICLSAGITLSEMEISKSLSGASTNVVRQDLQQLESEISHRINKFEYHGKSNGRVPSELLLSSEVNSHYSDEKMFLYLCTPMPEKTYRKLLNIKEKLEKSTTPEEKQEFHLLRRMTMCTFTGGVSKKRLNKLRMKEKFYHRCYNYLHKQYGVETAYRFPYLKMSRDDLVKHINLMVTLLTEDKGDAEIQEEERKKERDRQQRQKVLQGLMSEIHKIDDRVSSLYHCCGDTNQLPKSVQSIVQHVNQRVNMVDTHLNAVDHPSDEASNSGAVGSLRATLKFCLKAYDFVKKNIDEFQKEKLNARPPEVAGRFEFHEMMMKTGSK